MHGDRDGTGEDMLAVPIGDSQPLLSLTVGEYHKGVSEPVKQAALDAFRAGEIRVLVCTDSAARGLDIPNIRHVIQVREVDIKG